MRSTNTVADDARAGCYLVGRWSSSKKLLADQMLDNAALKRPDVNSVAAERRDEKRSASPRAWRGTTSLTTTTALSRAVWRDAQSDLTAAG
jgi:hypothetical protein